MESQTEKTETSETQGIFSAYRLKRRSVIVSLTVDGKFTPAAFQKLKELAQRNAAVLEAYNGEMAVFSIKVGGPPAFLSDLNAEFGILRKHIALLGSKCSKFNIRFKGG